MTVVLNKLSIDASPKPSPNIVSLTVQLRSYVCRHLTSLIFSIILLLNGFGKATVLVAQPQNPISSERVWLPILGYDSDTGIALGTIGRSFTYSDGFTPYYRSFSARAMATTKGFYTVDLEFDQLETFGTRARSTLTLFAERFNNEPYFGSGNNTLFDPSLWQAGYYDYERREFGLSYEGFMPLSSPKSEFTAGILWRFDFRIDDSKPIFSTSLFGHQGLGNSTALALLPGIGFRIDSRDHELLPIKGLFAEANVQASIPTSTIAALSLWQMNLRGFFPLLTLPFFDQVIFAQQLTIDHSEGDVPFWLQPRLGSRDGLRGAYLNRYQGSSAWLYMAELRSWFFEWERAELRFGGQFFWDMGRVFSNQASFEKDPLTDNLPNPNPSFAPENPNVFSQLHTSYGFGGVMGVGSEAFFLRMDFGFSKESNRIYLGAGYSF